ncbi:Elongation factor G [Bienertia sinuspersici]
MKNVAKCDTWCELQNPVNHRVFERKLRPKPSGRGHVCLGITHRVSPNLPSVGRGRKMASLSFCKFNFCHFVLVKNGCIILFRP